MAKSNFILPYVVASLSLLSLLVLKKRKTEGDGEGFLMMLSLIESNGINIQNLQQLIYSDEFH